MRLDNELVNRKIFETRNKAQMAIKDNIILCNGKVINKPSYEVSDETIIEVSGNVLPYVSRAGLKLEKALKEFNIDMNEKVMIDIGSSTGGFTDCALQNGASKVIAVDVGTDQMASKLREDKRVMLFENTDFRKVDIDIISMANIATIDVSFISVTKIIDIFHMLNNLREVVCLIKPQFECGMELASKHKGIVNDKNIHINAILNVIESFNRENYYIDDLTSSPIKGGSGNIEYLAHFNRREKEEVNKIDREKALNIVSETLNNKDKI